MDETLDAPTRRGFLAAAGATLLAGCGGLGSSDDSRGSIPSTELPDVTDDGESDPILAETVPITIERSTLTAANERVSELLGTLPVPLGPEELPNGHVRARLLDAAADARTRVEDAQTAGSRLVSLRSLRSARARARYAAAGWAVIERGLTVETLQQEHRRAVSEATAFRRNHEYIGTDLVDAILIHAHIEDSIEHVLADHRPRTTESGSLLSVAEWGEQAESARAHVADSNALAEQFATSLPDDAGSVESELTAATEQLTENLRRRRDDLPPEPTRGDRDFAWWLRYRLRDDAESSVDRVAKTERPAGALLAAVDGLTDFLAYERVREQIEDGERFRVEEAGDVRAARSRAHDAIRTALSESERPELARPALADAAATVAFADESLSRYHGSVRLQRLDDPVRQYTIATVRARSVPAASGAVLDALRSA